MGSLVTPVTRLLGVVLLVVGLLGFVMPSPLLGIFEVDMVHNIVHLASGLVALLVARNVAYARMYLILFGLVYLAVAVIGYIQVNTVLGLFAVNMADHYLHAAIAALCLVVGFGGKR